MSATESQTVSKTAYRQRFTRHNVTVYVEERIRELEASLDPTWAAAFPKEALILEGALQECKRLRDYWKLEKL